MWEYRYLLELVFSFPLLIFPEVEFMDCIIVVFKFLRTIVFHRGCAHLFPYQQCTISFSPTSSSMLIACLFDDSHPDTCQVKIAL